MPDEFYRRCPSCPHSAPGAPCLTCGGERYVSARLDGKGRRCRFRISTLMLLVVIAALSLSLVLEHRKRVLSEELARANEQRARAEAARALDRAAQAQASAAQAQAKTPIPTPVRPAE
jgi:hypothetical protein